MKIKIITDSDELEKFTSREDITISKIDVRSCEQSFFAQQYFVAVVMYEESTSDNFDWQSFRAEAAKDILCAMISNEGVADERNVDDFTKDNQVKDAVLYADKLIAKLKEKEEK